MLPYILLLCQGDSVPLPPVLQLLSMAACRRLRGVGLGVVLLMYTLLVIRWDDCNLLSALSCWVALHVDINYDNTEVGSRMPYSL